MIEEKIPSIIKLAAPTKTNGHDLSRAAYLVKLEVCDDCYFTPCAWDDRQKTQKLLTATAQYVVRKINDGRKFSVRMVNNGEYCGVGVWRVK